MGERAFSVEFFLPIFGLLADHVTSDKTYYTPVVAPVNLLYSRGASRVG